MKRTALTPVERGLLFILMTCGDPIKQADFKKNHGLTVSKDHRQKLEELGLINVSKDPLTFSLTRQGWKWLTDELTAPRPKGVLGLGPLYAALGAINRLAKRLGMSLEEALGPESGRNSTSNGGEVPWLDVDEPLARGLQDIPVFAASFTRLKEVANSTLEKEIKRAEMSANLVFQSLRLAAAKRKLKLDGQIGSETSYDPVLFHSDDLVKLGEPVRIRKSAVTRGDGKTKVIIQLGLAEALHDSR